MNPSFGDSLGWQECWNSFNCIHSSLKPGLESNNGWLISTCVCLRRELWLTSVKRVILWLTDFHPGLYAADLGNRSLSRLISASFTSVTFDRQPVKKNKNKITEATSLYTYRQRVCLAGLCLASLHKTRTFKSHKMWPSKLEKLPSATT